jgi:hypothetical protein
MPGKKRVSTKIPSAGLHSLLQKLAADNSVRKAFMNDPQGIFAQHDIVVRPEAIPARVTLPSKENLSKALARIPSRATGDVISAFLFFFIFAIPTSKKK